MKVLRVLGTRTQAVGRSDYMGPTVSLKLTSIGTMTMGRVSRIRIIGGPVVEKFPKAASLRGHVVEKIQRRARNEK